MKSQLLSARLFGFLFICSFLSYGIGMELMSVVQHTNSLEEDLLGTKNQIIIGGFLIVLFHTFFNLGLLSIMSRVVSDYGRTLSLFYLVLGIVSTIMLAIGGICLLLPVAFIDSELSSAYIQLEAMVRVGASTNFYLYQFGMTLWGLGGLALCYLFYKSVMIPRLLTIAGFVAYVIFIVGTTAEILGYHIGLMLSIPGGLFEISLSIWLLIKGFSKTNMD